MSGYYKTAADVIRDVGVSTLGGYDGCLCTHFMVRGVYVDVSCRKSNTLNMVYPEFYGIGLRVYSHHMDATGESLRTAADEVARQLTSELYAIKVRYCDYETDKKCKCNYCGKPRQDALAYLCDECFPKENPFGEKLADRYDYRPYEFTIESSFD